VITGITIVRWDSCGTCRRGEGEEEGGTSESEGGEHDWEAGSSWQEGRTHMAIMRGGPFKVAFIERQGRAKRESGIVCPLSLAPAHKHTTRQLTLSDPNYWITAHVPKSVIVSQRLIAATLT